MLRRHSPERERRAREEKAAEKQVEKPIEKPVQKPTEKPVENPVNKPIEKPTEKPVQKLEEKPEKVTEPSVPGPPTGEKRKELDLEKSSDKKIKVEQEEMDPYSSSSISRRASTKRVEGKL